MESEKGWKTMIKLRKAVSMMIAGVLLLGVFSPGVFAGGREYADAAEVSAEEDLKYLAFTDKVENGADITARELDVENIIRLDDKTISNITLDFAGNYMGAEPKTISAESKASDVFKVNYEPGRYRLAVTDIHNREYQINFNVFFSIKDDNYWEELLVTHNHLYPYVNDDDLARKAELLYSLQGTSLDDSYQGDDYRLTPIKFGMPVYCNGKYVYMAGSLDACNLRCTEDANWKRHIGIVPGQSDLIESYNPGYHYYLTAIVPIKVPVGLDIMNAKYHDNFGRGILYYEVDARNMELTEPEEPDSGASSGTAVTAPAVDTETPKPTVPAVKDTPKTDGLGTKIGSAATMVKKERLPKVRLKKYMKGTKIIKGMAKARSRVVLKIGKKTYTVKVSGKGKFTVKLKKRLKKGQKITVYAKLGGWKNSKKVSKKVK